MSNDIEQKIIEHFAEFNKAKFAEWLENGLIKTYSDKSTNTNPFDPVYPGNTYRDMRSYETLSGFLGLVYTRFIPENNKKIFRESIGDVFKNQINSPKLNKEGCEDLIYLTFEVNAYEAFDSLASFATKEKLSPHMYSTIAVLKSFPSEKVYNAIEKLADSPNFDERYSFEVIKILAEANPTQAKYILIKFEPKIKKLLDLAGNDMQKKNSFLDAKNNCLTYLSRRIDSIYYQDTWLIKDM